MQHRTLWQRAYDALPEHRREKLRQEWIEFDRRFPNFHKTMARKPEWEEEIE